MYKSLILANFNLVL